MCNNGFFPDLGTYNNRSIKEEDEYILVCMLRASEVKTEKIPIKSKSIGIFSFAALVVVSDAAAAAASLKNMAIKLHFRAQLTRR